MRVSSTPPLLLASLLLGFGAVAQDMALVQRLNGLWATDCRGDPRGEWGRWSVAGEVVDFDYGEARSSERAISAAGHRIETEILSANVPGVEAGQRFSYEFQPDGTVRITDQARKTVETVSRCE